MSVQGGSVPPADTVPRRLTIPPRALRLKNRPPAPLKHLSFSTTGGFALRMSGDQEITAEIRNGAGRTLAYTSRTLDPGEWTLRPRNLAPGLYTVLLRTGPNLRALRMKIEDAERGQGKPEWVLERVPDSTGAPTALPRGAFRSVPAGAEPGAADRPDRRLGSLPFYASASAGVGSADPAEGAAPVLVEANPIAADRAGSAVPVSPGAGAMAAARSGRVAVLPVASPVAVVP
jgi:hypothetical protein